MKVIKRTRNQMEATIIVDFLNSHRVEAELLDGHMNSVLPVGVRIAVPDDQEQEALRLLAQAQAGVMSGDDEAAE